MKNGSVCIESKMYNLDDMTIEELENLFEKTRNNKDFEFSNAKKMCKREFIENQTEMFEDISSEFKKFFDNIEENIKSEACIYKAIVDKYSRDGIIKKVNNKRNAIISGIKLINSKFLKSKEFKIIQEEIDKTLLLYENNLKLLANMYDEKIEKLILEKVGKEAHLVGKIIREEYLIEEENKRNDAKENDKLLKSLSNSIKNAILKLTKKQEEKDIDITTITELKDKEELELEQKEHLMKSIEKTQYCKKDNLEEISIVEEEILSIEKEMKKLNEIKKDKIINAMESEEKQIVVFKDKVSVFSKIKRFFSGKFNTRKLILEEIIKPLKEQIEKFNELNLNCEE